MSLSPVQSMKEANTSHRTVVYHEDIFCAEHEGGEHLLYDE